MKSKDSSSLLWLTESQILFYIFLTFLSSQKYNNNQNSETQLILTILNKNIKPSQLMYSILKHININSSLTCESALHLLHFKILKTLAHMMQSLFNILKIHIYDCFILFTFIKIVWKGLWTALESKVSLFFSLRFCFCISSSVRKLASLLFSVTLQNILNNQH